MKKCGKCKIFLEESLFNKCSTKKDGLSSYCKKCNKEYHKNNKEKRKQYKKPTAEDYRNNYKEKREIILKNRKKRIESMSDSELDKIKEYNKNWRQSSRGKKWKSEYSRKKYKTDQNVRLRNNLRKRIREELFKDGSKKSLKTYELLGCDLNQLKKHLESLFQKGMKWENYGIKGWHIDHIKPCASFDLTKIKEQKECFHYSNLQPLWWFENLSKGSKYEN